MNIEPTHLENVKYHLARALYAQDWAEWAERAGAIVAGMQIMDQLGPTAPRYLAQAADVVAQHERANKLTFE